MNESICSFLSVAVTFRPIQKTIGSSSRPVGLYGVRTVIAVALPSTLAIAPTLSRRGSLVQRLVVDLEEVVHLGLPAVANERHVIGVLVVRLVGVRALELHAAAEAEAVLRAHLAQQLVRLDAGDGSQRGLGREEVALLRGARLVDEDEGHGVPDSAGGHGRHPRQASPRQAASAWRARNSRLMIVPVGTS